MSPAAPFVRQPSRRLKARVAGVLAATSGGFVTRAVDALDLSFDGIEGDGHAGATRRSGGREPWYPRGTTIRNERQLSLLCPAELAEIAEALAIPALAPEWLGGNLVIEGLPRFSWLPARTLLFFEGGVTIKIDGDNAPCRKTGRAVAKEHGERPDLELAFVAAARHRRGLVGWVEKPGRIERGEAVDVRLPEQWLYS